MSRYLAQIIDKTGDSESTAKRRLNELEKFLTAVVETGEVLVPSRWVDIGWHALLADPKLYEEFLRACGLRYVTHTPGPPAPERYQRTVSELRRRHGRLDEIAWPTSGSVDCDGRCLGESGMAACSGCGGGAGDHS